MIFLLIQFASVVGQEYLNNDHLIVGNLKKRDQIPLSQINRRFISGQLNYRKTKDIRDEEMDRKSEKILDTITDDIVFDRDLFDRNRDEIQDTERVDFFYRRRDGNVRNRNRDDTEKHDWLDRKRDKVQDKKLEEMWDRRDENFFKKMNEIVDRQKKENIIYRQRDDVMDRKRDDLMDIGSEVRYGMNYLKLFKLCVVHIFFFISSQVRLLKINDSYHRYCVEQPKYGGPEKSSKKQKGFNAPHSGATLRY